MYKNGILLQLPTIRVPLLKPTEIPMTSNAQIKKAILADFRKYMNRCLDEEADNVGVYEAEDWEDALNAAIDKALKKNEGKKKKKDPNAPKRPTTAFMYFSQANRGKIKERYPDLKFGEVAKKTGEKWRALPEDKKEKYNKMAKKDKKRYEQEMERYKTRTDAEMTETEGGTDTEQPTHKKTKKKSRRKESAESESEVPSDSDSDVPKKNKKNKKNRK